MPSAFTVIGRYQIVDRLAEGGMGSLYLAKDPALDRLVAIKVLRGDFQDEELQERFSREARSISRLRHPNIVTIFEYGEYHEQPFIAMEYIAGESLAEVIRRRAPLMLSRKLQMIEEICAGMGYAHRARIVHRDLKPANLMVDSDGGMIKILDFGIARNLESGLTRFTQIVGTPSYMSPEQAAGSRVDHRSDIFSIGAVFYELLSYRRAFDGESHLTILDHIRRDEPVPLAQLSPGLDAGIFRIVDKALEKDPGRRYQDLETMRADVAAVRERLAQNAAEATVIVPGGAPSLVSPVASALEKRRAIQVKQALEAAEAAFARHDYEAALESCEQVLLLEQANARALGLIDEARLAIDQLAIDRHVEEARGHVNAGEITKAEDAVAEALKLGSGNPAALALQKELGQIRRERERARERAASAGLAISRARASLAEGALDSALRAVREAFVFAPASPDAIELKELITAAIEKRGQEEELARRVNEAVQSAKQRFHAGDHDGAIEELERFAPATPAIAQVLSEFRQSIATIARLRQLEEERQHREAEEQRKREEQEQRLERERQRQLRIGRLIPQVERSAGAEDFDAALQALSDLEQLDPDAAELARLRQLVASRRDEAEAAARRKRLIDDHVAAGRRLAGEQQWDEALTEIDAALQLDSQHAQAARLRSGIVRAIDERRRAEQREREIGESVADARRMSDGGDPEGAVASLERLDQSHPLVASVLKECRALAEAAALARSEEQRRKDEAERLARERWLAERFQQARASLDASRFDEALTVLDEISGRMPDAAGVSDLRSLTIAARSNYEAAERRRREIERRLTLGREHLGRGSWQAAFAEIDRALALDPQDDTAIGLRRTVAEAQRAEREAQDAAERERQRLAREKREAEEAAAERERQREIEQRLTIGREHLAHRSWRAAFAEIDRALALDPQNDTAITLRRTVADAQKEALETAERERQRLVREKREAEEAAAERERQREIEQRLTLGREHLAGRSWQAAFAEIDRALALDPQNDTAIALRRSVADAQRAEREAQETAERERQRLAREKRKAEEAAAERERQREIEQRLTLAREHLAGRSWQAAFAEVDRALALDPQNDTAIALRRTVADAQGEALETAERERQRLAREKREVEEAAAERERQRLALERQAAERERQRLAAEQRRLSELARVCARVEKQLSKNRLDRAEEMIAAAETALGPSEELENLRLRIDAAREAQTALARAASATSDVGVVPAQDDDEATADLPPVPSPWEPETAQRRLAATAMPRFVGLAVIVALAIGLVVIGVKGWLRQPTGDSGRASTARPPVESNPPASPLPSFPIPSSASPAPEDVTKAAPATTPAAATPPAAPVRDPLAPVRQQLRDQLTRGDQRQALATIGQGLAIKPDEPELVGALTAMLRDAQADAIRARDEADRANAAALAGAEYEQGRAAFDRASARDRSRRQDAVTDYWTAATQFRQARERAALVKPEPRPVPPTQAPPQQTVSPSPTVQRPPAQQPLPTPPPPQPPAQTAPAPPQPAVDTVAADRQAINQVLDQYEAAYSALKAGAVAQVSRAIPTSELEKQFDFYRSLRIVLGSRQIDVQGDTATVACARAVEGVLKRGNTRAARTAPATFKLRRAGRSWIIESEVDQ